MSQKVAIPRYYSIWRSLWSRITSGYYPAGSLLGTEVGLANEFGVSRVTLREALARLEAEGLVERRRSLGTFVAQDVVPKGVVEFTGYLDDIVLQADSATTTSLTFHEVVASDQVATALTVPPGSSVLQVRRLRSTNEVPRLWILDYLPPHVAADLPRERLETESIISLLDRDPDNRLSWAQQTFGARTGSDEVCERLALEKGSPVLYADRVIYDGRSVPVAYAEMFYPGSFNFAMRLGRIT